MGSLLVKTGATNGVEYRIYNIDNVYTIYIKIENRINPKSSVSEPLYSAVKSFPTLKEAKDYASTLSK